MKIIEVRSWFLTCSDCSPIFAFSMHCDQSCFVNLQPLECTSHSEQVSRCTHRSCQPSLWSGLVWMGASGITNSWLWQHAWLCSTTKNGTPATYTGQHKEGESLCSAPLWGEVGVLKKGECSNKLWFIYDIITIDKNESICPLCKTLPYLSLTGCLFKYCAISEEAQDGTDITYSMQALARSHKLK